MTGAVRPLRTDWATAPEPRAGVEAAPPPPPQEMRYLSPAEITRLAEAMPERYRALIVFDAFCGLRLSEVAGLRRAHVDLAARKVRVSENAVEVRGRIEGGRPKTRAGIRTVPMPPKVAAVLERHLAQFVGLDDHDLVFAGAEGGVLRAGAFRSRIWTPAPMWPTSGPPHP